jgi:hypothetical protein
MTLVTTSPPTVLCLLTALSVAPGCVPREDVAVPAAVCSSIAPSENPLHDPQRIAGFEILSGPNRPGKPLMAHVLTREWLSAIVACDHQIRHTEHPNCPLALEDVQVSVDSTGHYFAVYMTSDDRNVAKEIVRRAARVR